MFEEVEGALYRLEDLNEMLDLQSRELDHRFQLALYKEKKLIELNNFKSKYVRWKSACCSINIYFKLIFLAKLANEHTERLSQHELNQQKKLKERRETFEEAFKEDLEEYKTTGSIPSMFFIYFHKEKKMYVSINKINSSS